MINKRTRITATDPPSVLPLIHQYANIHHLMLYARIYVNVKYEMCTGGT